MADGGISAVQLTVKHSGPLAGVSMSTTTFSGHFGIGDAPRAVTMWDRIVDRKYIPA